MEQYAELLPSEATAATQQHIICKVCTGKAAMKGFKNLSQSSHWT